MGSITDDGTATRLVCDTLVDDGPDSHHAVPEGSFDQLTQMVTFNMAPESLAGDWHPALAGSYGATSISIR